VHHQLRKGDEDEWFLTERRRLSSRNSNYPSVQSPEYHMPKRCGPKH
jgi:hypothetical protein